MAGKEIDWDRCFRDLEALPAAAEIREAIGRIDLDTTLSIDVAVVSHPPHICVDVTPLSDLQEDEFNSIQSTLADIVGDIAAKYHLRAYSGGYFPACTGERKRFSSRLPGFVLKPADYKNYRV